MPRKLIKVEGEIQDEIVDRFCEIFKIPKTLKHLDNPLIITAIGLLMEGHPVLIDTKNKKLCVAKSLQDDSQ